jgi:membrane-associated phospholipid phosphatase
MSLKKANLIIFIFCLTAIFMQLACYVSRNPINNWDLIVTKSLQYNHSQKMDFWMSNISLGGNNLSVFAIILAIAAIYYVSSFKREALFISLIPLTEIAQFILQKLIDRPRPTDLYVRVLEYNTPFGFPSSIVTTYVVFFGYQIILMFWLEGVPIVIRHIVWQISFFMISVIAYSRIYLGTQWLTDTIAGYILGLIMLSILCWAYFKVQLNKP